MTAADPCPWCGVVTPDAAGGPPRTRYKLRGRVLGLLCHTCSADATADARDAREAERFEE